MNAQMYVIVRRWKRERAKSEEKALTLLDSTNLVIILVMMQLSKKVPFDDPNVLNGVRALYILSNVIIVGVYFYVQQQIKKKHGKLSRSTGILTLDN